MCVIHYLVYRWDGEAFEHSWCWFGGGRIVSLRLIIILCILHDVCLMNVVVVFDQTLRWIIMYPLSMVQWIWGEWIWWMYRVERLAYNSFEFSSMEIHEQNTEREIIFCGLLLIANGEYRRGLLSCLSLYARFDHVMMMSLSWCHSPNKRKHIFH